MHDAVAGLVGAGEGGGEDQEGEEPGQAERPFAWCAGLGRWGEWFRAGFGFRLCDRGGL